MIVIDFLDVFYGSNSQTNFTSKLFRLIHHADRNNLQRLKQGFPLEVELYEWWQKQETLPLPEEVKKKITELEGTL